MNHDSVVNLYTNLANNPDKDFGWDKGLQNALNHGYKPEWVKQIPEPIWAYCAAVGNPFSAGTINTGDYVLDIGCGAGVDLCVASLLAGEQGRVFGVDVTPAMVEKATQHANLAGLSNITALEGSIEQLPIDDNYIDVVISNGAINLAHSKENVFAEVYRVLKPGGQLYFSDMIKDENYMQECCCSSNDSWADCIAGTLKSDELIKILLNSGFKDVELLGTNHYKTSASTIGACFSAKK
jgi:arsenite methyltransferase